MADIVIVIRGNDALNTVIAADKINLDPRDYLKLVIKSHFKNHPIDPPDWYLESNDDFRSFDKDLLEGFIEYHNRLKERHNSPTAMGSSVRKDQVSNSNNRRSSSRT